MISKKRFCYSLFYKITVLGALMINCPVFAADLIGFDGRPHGPPHDQSYYDVQEDTAYWGGQIHFQFAVWNQAAGNAGAFKVKFVVSDDNVIDGNDHIFATMNYPSGLNSGRIGGIKNFGATMSLPSVDPVGGSSPYYIGMIVDYDNDVAESNENNNANQGFGKDYDSLTIEVPLPDVQVSDSSGDETDRSLDFGDVVDDSAGNSSGTETVTLVNYGPGALTVSQNGIYFADGTHFKIDRIISSTQEEIDLSRNAWAMAANAKESWIVTLKFDPSAVGVLTDTLNIISDDPDEGTIIVNLQGTGTPLPNIVISEQDQALSFGQVPNDGLGGQTLTQSMSFQNNGSGLLVIPQNGISLDEGANFSIVAISSDTQGVIDLSSGSGSLAEDGSETWTIEVLCDPVVDGQVTDSLNIASDDPDEAGVTITLSALGLSVQDITVDSTVVDFGGIHADGNGEQVGIATLSLSNQGEAALHIDNIQLTTGSVYQITEVFSDKQGTIDLTSDGGLIAGSGEETWKVTLRFDPDVAGSVNDTLSIVSNDSDESPLVISLSGTGLDEADIEVAEGLVLEFTPTLNDGAGGIGRDKVLTLSNIGTQVLNISQIDVGSVYSITGISSSSNGNVTLPSAILPGGVETWEVTLHFDPNTNGDFNETLQIMSNDPDENPLTIALSGSGSVPSITLTEPALNLGVNAEQMYAIRWVDDFTGGDAEITLYLDPDTHPNNGNEIQIVSGLSEEDEQDFYAEHVAPELIGNQYYVYAVIQSGTITATSYSPGRLLIEAVNAFRLLSPLHTTQSEYSYQYRYQDQTYSGSQTLTTGLNRILVENEGVQHEFFVTYYDNTLDRGQYTYDEMNRIDTYTNGNGIVTTHFYDKLSRLEKQEYSNGTTVEYSYDVVGNLLSVYDGRGYIFYSYDDWDRPVEVIHSEDDVVGNADDRKIAYDYDLDNRLTQITYPGGGFVEYVYDSASRLEGVKDYTSGNLQTTLFSYNATTSLLEEITRPNGVKTRYSYDGSARLSDLEHRNASDVLIARYHYEYDADSRRTELHVTTPAGTRKEKYTYDDVGQVIEVVYSDNGTFDADDKTVTYTYDSNGNRLSMLIVENQTALKDYRYYYGHENRLLQRNERFSEQSTRFYHDPAGNRIMKVDEEETTRYFYDERNLLTRVITSTQDIGFEYDATGNRIAKIVNGVRTEYTVNALGSISQVIEEYDANAQRTARYTYGGSRISGVLQGESNATYYLSDGLGSTRLLSDVSGMAGTEFQYDVFGEVTAGPVSANEYLFTGERMDAETGLVYLRARYYAPEVGAFITKDPMGLSAGMNSFVYVENDPVNAVDPLGLKYFYRLNDQSKIKEDSTSSMFPFGKLLFWDFLKGSHNYAGSGALGGDIKSHSDRRGYLHDRRWQYARENSRLDPFINPKTALADMALAGGAISDLFKSENKYGNYSFIQKLGYKGALIGEAAIFGPLGIVKLVAGVPGVIGNTIKSAGNPIKNTIKSVFTSNITPNTPGGVLIDKAAQLIGSNLSDIRGATYDPESGQIVFLGTDNDAAVKDINLDYFFTAIQAVYGSAVPPFVTLDPPASLLNQWMDLGDGDGVWEPGEMGGVVLHYHPIWADEADDLRVRFDLSGGTTFFANIDSFEYPNIQVGTPVMILAITDWTDKPTDIDLADNINGGIILGEQNSADGFRLLRLQAGRDGQYGYYRLYLQNNGTQNYIMDSVKVIPNLQHRKYGGRVEGSKLGWVMYEADRVMKCLGVGVDNLVDGKTYTSANVPISGYQNFAERLQDGGKGGNVRMWFIPDEMTLKRHIDEETGQATIVFDQASVALKTESKMRGLPQTPIARDFADHFNTYYDEFAALDFPVMDPDDPTGQTIIEVPIFKMLRDAMQAVALARFFRDNEIPLDMWWLNAWEPPYAYSPKTIPTAYNEEAGILIYGGVEVNTPNKYVPSADAESIGDLVNAQRPAAPVGSDIAKQDWNITDTTEGDLTAVAVSLEATEQDSTTRLSETDLAFASPGSHTLAFGRYYSSAFLGKNGMGPGWKIIPLTLEFGYPSWYDEQGLMKNVNGEPLWTDRNKDTRLHGGEIRLVNHANGQVLNFYSSLELRYDVDNLGHPIIAVDGLDANDLPTFTPGEWQNGSTLQQTTNDREYILTLPDNSTVHFRHDGKLLSIVDKHNYTLSYTYNSADKLTTISDDAGQTLNLSYNTDNQVESVSGPYSEQVTYSYDLAGRLETATHTRSEATTTYAYNENDQLITVTQFDGLMTLNTTPDLRGRSDSVEDTNGNIFDHAFSIDPETQDRTTTVTDTISQASWKQSFDEEGRLTATRGPLGNGYEYDYYDDSQYPNSVQLPIEDRAAIQIDRNDNGQPTLIRDPEILALGGQASEIIYNEDYLPVQVTDARGRVTEYTYNANQDIKKITRYLDGQAVETIFSYQNGNLHTVTDSYGNIVQTINYDNLGRVTDITDAAGITVNYTYDGLGRLWKITDPRLSSDIVYTYNDFDQLTQLMTPTGTTLYDYYPDTQWLKTITSPTGHQQEHIYDLETGDLIETRQIMADADDLVIGYEYNRLGQFESLKMPEGQTVSYTYDDLNRPIQIDNSDYSIFVLTEPDGLDDTADQQFDIEWIDEDTDHNADIALYFDTNNSGEDGTLIVQNLSEDDPNNLYAWDTSSLPEGDYYVYAVINDGVNPATVYSEGTVNIAHTPSNCDDVADGLVFCSTFEGNANDESGNGNHGTEKNGITYVRGW
ncbi:MAG: hypothetical protein DRR19_09210 [Candidatus Parabeggiatoa sp. nov. 1]|nr:MAG: hypothetical protein DRR19_09210 [Gammaproteobacteria bacterium]